MGNQSSQIEKLEDEGEAEDKAMTYPHSDDEDDENPQDTAIFSSQFPTSNVSHDRTARLPIPQFKAPSSPTHIKVESSQLPHQSSPHLPSPPQPHAEVDPTNEYEPDGFPAPNRVVSQQLVLGIVTPIESVHTNPAGGRSETGRDEWTGNMQSEQGSMDELDPEAAKAQRKQARREKRERKAARREAKLQKTLVEYKLDGASDQTSNNAIDDETVNSPFLSSSVATADIESQNRKRRSQAADDSQLLEQNGEIDIGAHSSPAKRKATDSGRKKSKKHKRQSDHCDVNFKNDFIEDEDQNEEVESMANDTSANAFGNYAQNLYAQRFTGQTNIPNNIKPEPVEDYGVRLNREEELQEEMQEDLQEDLEEDLQENMQEELQEELQEGLEEGLEDEPRHQDDDQDSQYQESEAPLPAESDDANEGDDASMPDAPMGDSEDALQLGSDDLGVAGNMEVDNGEERNDHSTDQFSNPLHSPPQTDILSSTFKQSRKQPASGSRRRVAKPTFFDREQQKHSVETTAKQSGSGSYAIVTPSRGRPSGAQKKKFIVVENAEAGPSTVRSSTNEKGKQVKISAMLRGESTPSTSSKFVSKTPKVNNPPPEEGQTGPFSQFDLRNIDKAMELWRNEHDLTQEKLNDIIHKNPHLAKSGEFWDHIHASCPKRKRQKVINQVRRIYHNFVARGTWTEEQQEELVHAYELHGPKYRKIADQINRHPEDVRDRVRNYVVCGNHRQTATWTAEEEARLIEIIENTIATIEKMRAEGTRGFQNMSNEALIDWQTVSENMGRTRSRLQCRNKWKTLKAVMEGGQMDGVVGLSVDDIIQQAREETAAMSHRDRYKVVKVISGCGAMRDSRIPWAKCRSELKGQWNRATLMVLWYRLRAAMAEKEGTTDSVKVPDMAAELCFMYKQTKELNYLPEDQLDLKAEHRSVSHTLSKILKANRAKTPHLIVNSDDEDDDEDGDKDGSEDDDKEEDEDELKEEAQTDDEPQTDEELQAIDDIKTDEEAPSTPHESSKRHSSRGRALSYDGIDLGLDKQTPIPVDREIEDSVLGSPTTAKGKGKASLNGNTSEKQDRAKPNHVVPTVEKDDRLESTADDKDDGQPVSLAKGNGQRKSQKKYTGSKSTTSPKTKLTTTPSSRKRQARSRSRRLVQLDIDDPSSDTNADDVEDIPARR